MQDFEFLTVPNVFWVNSVDTANPYQTGIENHYWNYIKKNFTFNNNIELYLKKVVRKTTCVCLDGCIKSKSCPCYKWNKKLLNPTYTMFPDAKSGQTILFQ